MIPFAAFWRCLKFKFLFLFMSLSLFVISGLCSLVWVQFSCGFPLCLCLRLSVPCSFSVRSLPRSSGPSHVLVFCLPFLFPSLSFIPCLPCLSYASMCVLLVSVIHYALSGRLLILLCVFELFQVSVQELVFPVYDSWLVFGLVGFLIHLHFCKIIFLCQLMVNIWTIILIMITFWILQPGGSREKDMKK